MKILKCYNVPKNCMIDLIGGSGVFWVPYNDRQVEE